MSGPRPRRRSGSRGSSTAPRVRMPGSVRWPAHPGDAGHGDIALRTTSYAVVGVGCRHCVSALADEVSLLPGVYMVVVDVVPGGESRMSVTGSDVLRSATVGLAVAEAGFELVGPVS